MAAPVNRSRGIAREEAHAIAGMLLAALDRGHVHDDHVHEGDGALDRSELPAEHFDEVDAEHRHDGVVTHEELEAAFLRLDPGTRRQLGAELRPLAAAHMAHKRRANRLYPFVAACVPVACGLGHFGLVTLAAGLGGITVLATGAMGAALWGTRRTRREIAELVDAALC